MDGNNSLLDQHLFTRLDRYIASEGRDFKAWTPPWPLSEPIVCEDLICSSPVYLGGVLGSPPKESEPADLLVQIRKLKDESFAERLLRLIDERDMTNAACYKAALVDRRVFSKILCNPRYTPKKPTVLALAFALELDLEETENFLKAAGYALSNNTTFDLIISYCIRSEIFDVFLVNEILLRYDQTLLGS